MRPINDHWVTWLNTRQVRHFNYSNDGPWIKLDLESLNVCRRCNSLIAMDSVNLIIITGSHCVAHDLVYTWWRHQMEAFSALLAFCAGNSLVTGELPAQRPVTRSFAVSLIWVWISSWANNGDADDLRRRGDSKYKSRGFENSRDLAIKVLLDIETGSWSDGGG